MSVTAARNPPVRPDAAELISRAREIAELVRARAQQTEAERRVSEDVIARMREAGLFRVMHWAAKGAMLMPHL